MTFFKDITKKVSNSAKVAARKSGNLVEVTKLGLNINTEEEKIKKAYAEIGEIIYKLYEGGKTTDSEYMEICKKIVSYKENIQDMRDKILFLKDIKICPQCNGELECKYAYCNMCGAKQEIPELCLEKPKEKDVEEKGSPEKGSTDTTNNNQFNKGSKEDITIQHSSTKESGEEELQVGD